MLPPLRIEKKPLSFRRWAFPFRSSIRGLSVKSSLIVSWHDESYRPSQRRRGCGKEILDRKVHFEAFETYGFLVVESVDRDGRAFERIYGHIARKDYLFAAGGLFQHEGHRAAVYDRKRYLFRRIPYV